MFAVLISSVVTSSNRALAGPGLDVRFPFEQDTFAAGSILVLHVKPRGLSPIVRMKAYAPGMLSSLAKPQGDYFRIILEIPSSAKGSLDIPIRAYLENGEIIQENIQVFIRT